MTLPQASLYSTIQLSDVQIAANRQRQEFDPEALQELVTSIETSGLMHPPVLRQDGDTFYLVAGERRLRAITQIFELGGQFIHNETLFTAGTGSIPYVSLGSLTALEAEEAELDENLKRRDLTWQELAAAHARLHTLRTQQKAAATAAVESEAPESGAATVATQAHTVADTAQELYGRRDGSYQDKVRKEILVARHLDNPLIAKAKSADEALKILKKEETRQNNIALAQVVGKTFAADKHKLFNVNCIEFMTTLADDPAGQRFDVILTDPPYGMGADTFGDGAGRLSAIEHHYDDSYESFVELMTGWRPGRVEPSHLGWCHLSYQVAKPAAHAYVFCDIDRFHELRKWMQEAGWYVFRTPLINVKANSGRVPLPDRGPRRQYEIVLYAIKGNKPVTHIYPDVITTSADENISHGAQKPVALYENLLMRSVRPGDEVADFFGGTGTLLPAAHTYKCSATVTEQNPEYFAMCLQRVELLKKLDEPALF